MCLGSLWVCGGYECGGVGVGEMGVRVCGDVWVCVWGVWVGGCGFWGVCGCMGGCVWVYGCVWVCVCLRETERGFFLFFCFVLFCFV